MGFPGWAILVSCLGSSLGLQAAAPVIISEPQSLTIKQDTSATFSVLASGDEPISYQWKYNGTIIPGATAASYTIANAQPAQAGGYSVVVANTFGAATSQVAWLTVLLPPAILQSPSSLSVIQGNEARFNVLASWDEPIGYQWYYQETNAIPGAIEDTLVLSNVQAAQAGDYRVVVTNLVGSATSAVARLTVLLPPQIVAQPKNRVVVEGATHTFNVGVSGDAPFFYQWRYQGADLAGETNTFLTLVNTRGSQAGRYQVVITNFYGATTSLVALLSVRSTNDPLFAMPENGWAYIYTGDSVAIPKDNALDGTWDHDNSSDSWNSDGRGAGNGPSGGLSSANGILTLEDNVTTTTSDIDNRRFYFKHNLAQEGSVTNGSTLLSDGVTLSFRARLTPRPPEDPLTELANAPNGYVNNGSGRGMFGIRQGGANGMIVSFSLNQAAEDITTSSNWNFGQAGLHMNNLNGNTRSAAVDPNLGSLGGTVNLLPLDPSLFHEFWITIQDNGSAPGTHRVTVYLDGDLTPYVFNVTAGTGVDVSYSDPSSTNYLALGLGNSAQRGAVDVDYFAYQPGVLLPVTLNDPVGIVQQPSAQLIGAGAVASFNVGVTGAPPFVYQWYKNGNPIAAATNSSYTTPPAVPADDQAQFVVVISNICNVVTSTPAILNLLAPPMVVAQPQDQTVIAGGTAQFTIGVESPVPVSYQWRFNGSDLGDETNSTLVISPVSSLHAGAYAVVASNLGGSVTSVVARLTVEVYDFGDAPLPYPTLLASNGARHRLVSDVYLGLRLDDELNGQPEAAAAGDNLSGSDDEDGVTFTTPLRVGQMGNVQIVASTNGFINAWIDFQADGSWAEPADQILTNQPVLAGTNWLTLMVPAQATSSNTFARFRFNTTGGLSYAGSASDGEVEDYALAILPVADLAVAITAPEFVSSSSNCVFTLTVSNLGPSSAHGLVLTAQWPAVITFVQVSPSQGTYTANEGQLHWNLGDLGVSGVATVEVLLRAGFAGWITNEASVAGLELDLVPNNNTAKAITAGETPPVFQVPPVSLTTTQGSTVMFGAVVSGTAPCYYQWLFQGGLLEGETNSSLTISDAQPMDAGTYQLQASNRVGVALSPPATLRVLVAPGITQQPVGSTNNAGSTLTLTAAATGSEPLVWQWLQNGALIPGATNASLVLSPVQKTHAGEYVVRVSNEAGLAISQSAIVAVIEYDFGDAPEPYPTRQASNGARHVVQPGFYLGASIDFEADGQPHPSGGADDLNDLRDEDGISFLGPVMIGQITRLAVVASSNGWLNGWMDFDRDGTWSGAGEQIFTNQWLVAGTNWFEMLTPITATAPTNSFARFRFSSVPGLQPVGEAPDGEVEDYMVVINRAVELRLAVLGNPSLLALGSNLSYSVVLTNLGPSEATEVSFSNQFSGPVTFVSAETSEGACSNAAGILTCGLGAIPAGGMAMVSVTVVPNAAGALTNFAAVGSLEMDLDSMNNLVATRTMVQEYPVISLPPASQTVTNGDSVTFSVTAIGTDLGYQWLLNGVELAGANNWRLELTNVQPSHAGIYRVQVSNLVGSVLSQPATLTVLVPARITAQPQGRLALVGDTVRFEVSAEGTEPLVYHWHFNGQDIPNQTQATLVRTNVQMEHAGEYRVHVSNAAGQELSAIALLTVVELPQIDQQPESRTNYAGTTALFTVAAHGTEPLHYQWFVSPGNALAGADQSSLVLTNVQKSQAGSYWVVVSNSAGAVTSQPAQLRVQEMDFGDAPESYSTRLAFAGARHEIVSGLYLGSRVDYEPDGWASQDATGDNVNYLNDEDGIVFLDPLLVGRSARIAVIASSHGFLEGWIDFQGNGTWADPEDRICASHELAAGTNILSFQVPTTAVLSNTFARFRFSSAGGLSFEGAAADGEVEDYQVAISPVIDLALTITAEPLQVYTGSNMTYTLVVSNRGPSTARQVQVIDALPAGFAFVSTSPQRGSCSYQNGAVVWALDSLGAGERTTASIVVTAPAQPGIFTNSAQATASEFEANPADNFTTLASPVVLYSAPYVNSEYIYLPDYGPASVYPSTIQVSGLTADLYKVTATLSNLHHLYPYDLTVLLVSPRGQGVVLMAQVGAGSALNNVTITFDDDAPQYLPDRISTGVFKPTAPEGTSESLPAPAPPQPYTNQLAAFRGIDPNGVWSLYIVDTAVEDGGYLANGWSLQFSTLNPIAYLGVTQAATPAPVAEGRNLVYTLRVTNAGPAVATEVQLDDRLAESVQFISATTSGGTCTHDNGRVRCEWTELAVGAEASVSLVVIPMQSGILTNVVSVSGRALDFVLTDNTSELVTLVKPVADLSLTMIDQPGPAFLEQALTYTLQVTNHGPNVAPDVVLTDLLPAGMSFVSAVSSQGNCENNGATVQCALGEMASGSSAVVAIVARPSVVATLTNMATLATYAMDFNPANNSATRASTVTVPNGPYVSTGPLNIPAQGPAGPYPSTILVSGLTGEVFRVTVTLSNLAHNLPDDLDVLLVGPGGQAVLLMSDAGGTTGASNVTITLDDGAETELPDSGPLGTGLFKSANYGLEPDLFQAPAPFGPYAASLTALQGSNPNGIWALYVWDDQASSGGALGGWSLNIDTFQPIVDMTLTARTSQNPVAVGSNLTYTLLITNLGPAPVTGGVLTNYLPENVSFVSATVSQGNWTREGTMVRCALGVLAVGANASMEITVVPTALGTMTNLAQLTGLERELQPLDNVATVISQVDEPPVILLQPLSQIITNEDSVRFEVVAAGTWPLNYQWRHNGMDLPGATNSVLLLTNTALAQAGTYQVRVWNAVGGVLGDAATLTVLARPVISSIPDQVIDEDTVVGPLNFVVGDVETAASDLNVRADSSNSDLLPPANIFLSGSDGNRGVSIRPATNQFGSVRVTIWVTDQDGISASTSFNITVSGVNDLPVLAAFADQVTDEDVPKVINVRIGDTETAAEQLSISAHSSNAGLVPDANILFTGSGSNRVMTIVPTTNQAGQTTISLELRDTDGGLFSQNFDVVVNPVNDPPSLDPVSDLQVDEDMGNQSITLGGISSGAGNEPDALTVWASCDNTNVISEPVVSYVSPGATGTLTFSLRANANGTANITVNVSDGQSSNSVISHTFQVRVLAVDDPPTLSSLSDISILEDTSTDWLPFTIGDLESAAELLQVTVQSTDTALLSEANVTFAGSGTNRLLRLIPATNAFGTCMVTVTVRDPDGASTSTTFQLIVTPVNDRPTLDPIADLVVPKNAGLQTVILSGISAGAANENQPISVTATASAAGILTNLVVLYTSPNDTGTIQFQPLTNLAGAVTITVTIDDGTGVDSTISRSFKVDVNSPPSISNVPDVVVLEDTYQDFVPYTVNDLETAPQSLQVRAHSSNPELIPDENIRVIRAGHSGLIMLMPLTNRFGYCDISLTVEDSDGATATTTFRYTVLAVNDSPTLDPIADRTIGEDAGLQSIPLTGIGTGASNEFQNLGLSVVVMPSGILTNVVLNYGSPNTSGSLSFQTVSNAHGVVLVTVSVDDGQAFNNVFNRTFSVEINPINDPPSLSPVPNHASDEDNLLGPISFMIGDIESRPENLQVSAISGNLDLVPTANLVLGGYGSQRTLSILPATNQSGTASITLLVRDEGGLEASQSFEVTIQPVNDPPMLSSVPDQVTGEDAGLSVALQVGDDETSADALVLGAHSSNQALVPDANLTFGGSGASRVLTVTPAPQQFGRATITIEVRDAGGAMASRSFEFVVNPQNDTPTLDGISNLTLDEDAGPQTVNLTGISYGASNEVQSLVIKAYSSDPAIVPDPVVHYTNGNSTGVLAFTPVTNAFGTVTIFIELNDEQSLNNLFYQAFQVTVRSVNDSPSLSSLPDQVVTQDTPTPVLAFNVGDLETPADNLVLRGESSNPVLVPVSNIFFGGLGVARWVRAVPVSGQTGAARLTVVVTDEAGASNSVSFLLTVNALNRAPVVSLISNQVVNEDTATGPIAFTISDVDTPLGSLVLSGSSSNTNLVANGNIVLGGSGSNRTVTVSPIANQFGTTIITLSVSDGVTNSTTSFLLTVNPVNDPPTISDILNQVMDEDTIRAVAFTVSDLDTPLAGLVVSATSTNALLLPSASISLGGNGSNRAILLNPIADQYGQTLVTVSVTDGTTTNSDSFVLTVNPINDPPTLNPITNLNLNEDAGLQNVVLSGITKGPANESSQVLTITALSSNPGLIPNPTVSYTNGQTTAILNFGPVGQSNGTATITVTVNDGQAQNNLVSRSFLVTINPVTDPPGISAIAAQSVNEDTTLNVAFTVSSQDTPLQNLAVTAVSTNTLLVPNTNLFLDGSGANRLLTIVSATNQFGTTLITLTVRDGAVSNSTSFVLTVNAVNDVPTLDVLTNVFLPYSSGWVTISLAGINSGASNENQTLSLSVSNSNSAFYRNQPTLSYTSPNSTGSFTFRTDNSSAGVGTNRITVTVQDNGTSNNVVSRNFLVYCRPNNNYPPPSATGIGAQITGEGTPTPAIPFTVSSTTTPASLLRLQGLSLNPALLPSSNIVFGGSGSNRTVTLTPAANQSGTARVVISVIDTNYGGTNITFLLTVNPANDPPTISSFSNLAINEDTTSAVIPFTISDPETPAGSLTLSVFSANTNLVPNGNIIFGGSGTNRALTITPAANQNGTSAVTVVVSDGALSRSNSFVLTVNGVNDSPAISSITDQIISEDAALAVNFTVWDPETAAGSLTLLASSSNPALVASSNIVFGGSGSNRTANITPATNQFGTSVLSFTVNDGNGGTASVSFTLTVNPVNDSPGMSALSNQTISEDALLGPVNVTIGDAETPAEMLVMAGFSSNPALVPDTNIVFSGTGSNRTVYLSPLRNQSGTATITLSVNDVGGAASNRLFTLTVNPVNDAPVISPIADQVMDEDTVSALILFTVGDVETSAGSLVVTPNSSNPALVPAANLVLGGTGSNRTVRITPASNQVGLAVVSLIVNDGSGGSATNSFAVRVNPVNDPPMLSPIADQVTEENTATPAIGFEVGDLKSPAASLLVSARSSNAALVPDANIVFGGSGSNRTIRLTPAAHQSGSALITVMVTDGEGGTSSRSFTLTVNAVNELPSISAMVEVTLEEDNASGLLPLVVRDTETGAGELVVSGQSSQPGLIDTNGIVFGGSGLNRTVRLRPNTNQFGTAQITVSVRDSGGASASTSFMLTVNPVDDLPEISEIADQVTDEDTATAAIGFVISDIETAASNLVVTADASDEVLAPLSGLVLGGSGSNRTLTITPAVHQYGSAMITVHVSDGAGGSSRSFRLSVRQTSSVPLIMNQPQGQTVMLGGTATFGVVASGTTPLFYQWQHNGTDLPGRTNATLSLANLQVAQAGDYTVVVRNLRGAVTSAPATLRVMVQPVITGLAFSNGLSQIRFPTYAGFSYSVEFKNTLLETNWRVLEIRAGTGQVEQVEDPGARTVTRFYRVRVQ